MTKKKLFIFKLLLPLCWGILPLIACCQTIITGKVIRVADGDTITVLDSANTQYVLDYMG